MKDFTDIIDELDLEKVTGGLVDELALAQAGGRADKLLSLRPLVEKLKAEGYSLALASEAVAKLAPAKKLALAKYALADELASGRLAENDELALAKGLADVLAKIW